MSNKKDKPSKNQEDKLVSVNDTDPETVYILQKCQRMASALYAITQFFGSEEPLKARIREHGLSLIESVRPTEDGPNSHQQTVAILYQIRDQLAVARDGGLVSPANYAVFTEEIDNLVQRFNDGRVGLGPAIDRDDLAASQPEKVPAGGRNNEPVSSSSSNADGQDGQSSSSSSSSPRSAKQRRRQKILDLFDDTDEITVNDVTEVISGYSTKTIQRDLKALVENGTLEKHGKRRWTSYTLAA